MSTRITTLHEPRIKSFTMANLAKAYPALEFSDDEKDDLVLAIEDFGNQELIIITGDLSRLVQTLLREAGPIAHVWFTCVDCSSGDMTEETARWHASREGHALARIAEDGTLVDLDEVECGHNNESLVDGRLVHCDDCGTTWPAP